MTYAIIEAGGSQVRVEEDKTFIVDLLPNDVGDKVEYDVLLIANGDKVKIGQPTVKGAKVTASVVKHFKGKKIRVFKYRPKKRYRKTMGHRQSYTRMKVEKIKGA